LGDCVNNFIYLTGSEDYALNLAKVSAEPWIQVTFQRNKLVLCIFFRLKSYANALF